MSIEKLDQVRFNTGMRKLLEDLRIQGDKINDRLLKVLIMYFLKPMLEMRKNHNFGWKR
jgi:hypothetical protein